jgi:signal transduction histidine kinase
MTRVLYAEDDPQITDLVARSFSLYPDTQLITVNSGRRCLEAMAAGGFDLLLIELKMPDIDGLQVLGELFARGDSTPVIIVSGQGQAELAVRALRAGAADCIDKHSPDFQRIPECVQRTLTRLGRRWQNHLSPAPPTTPAVLYIDPDQIERDATARFFAASAPRLKLTAETPATLEAFLCGETSFDGIVLGPNLPTTAMLQALRQLRSRGAEVPIVVLAAHSVGETAVAAFQLGAHDYIHHAPGCLTELVFSLNHALKRAATERLAARLTGELATFNRSLADQVAARNRELEAEMLVRRAAERQAAAQAARSQALAARLLRVQEDERHVLARDLHDHVGQLLTGLRFQLEAARTTPTGPALSEALAVTDELLTTVRALTLQLRPHLLDDLGLPPAIEWQLETFRRQTGIAVTSEISLRATRLPRELEITVFRVVQEALTNVARHSGARAATVTVTADHATLHVEISDLGRGFDAPAALARRDSLGLAGLAERVQLADGRFELYSQPGHGTRLHAEFNLALAELPATP